MTILTLNGELHEVSIMEGKDIHDDEAVLQILRHTRVITADRRGYTIEGQPPVFDPLWSSSPLTNLQRALLSHASS